MIKAEIRQLLVDHYLDFYTLAYSMLANSDDARDTVQEALTRTLAKGRIDDPMNYCYQTVRNVAIDTMRYRSRIVPLDENMDVEQDEQDDTDSYARLLNLAAHLRDKLPSALRALVTLHYEKGIGYGELANLTGMSRMTIRRRLKEAQAKMHYELKKEMEETI